LQFIAFNVLKNALFTSVAVKLSSQTELKYL